MKTETKDDAIVITCVLGVIAAVALVIGLLVASYGSHREREGFCHGIGGTYDGDAWICVKDDTIIKRWEK